MTAILGSLPWAHFGIAFVGLTLYILTSLANPADENLSSVADVFLHRGKTVLTATLVTPILVMAAKQYGELNTLSAFCAGYMNVSVIRKAAEGWQARAKLTGN